MFRTASIPVTTPPHTTLPKTPKSRRIGWPRCYRRREVENLHRILLNGAGDFSAEILQQMWASSKDDGILVITAEELAALNRVLFGFLKSYRSMGAQMKAFFDSTDQL
ncbi:hypothetical protein S83_027269 [Arachis hypogaea]